LNFSPLWVLLLTVSATSVGGQAARVGRLDVLASSSADATCIARPASVELQRAGIARTLTVKDPAHDRLLSVGVSAAGTARILHAMMTTREERRGEGESVMILFDADERIRSGRRSAYTTGTPSRRSDDRQAALLPTDSARAKALARAVIRLCGV
jgi:hypothetical protein